MNKTKKSATELRKVKIKQNYTDYAEGSVLIETGKTRVLCNASVLDSVPSFMRGQGRGWITAEYSLLPRATSTRCNREAVRGKQSGRTLEISRLIGRALRSSVNMNLLGEKTIHLDCDVIQADGGTRCASITGSMVALVNALEWMRKNKQLTKNCNPLRFMIAAVSVGICNDTPILDLCYQEDSTADVDMNVVMTEDKRFIEIQGTAEGKPFSERQLTVLKKLAAAGIAQLIECQKKSIQKRT